MIEDLVCQVCNDEPAVGVACAMGMPVSLAYGRNCLQAGVESYELLVANTASIGGLDFAADWWMDEVLLTLAYFNIPMTDFLFDVDQSMQAEALSYEDYVRTQTSNNLEL